MQKIRNCKICKKKFIINHKTNYLCSDKCKKEARRKVSKKYYYKNRKKIIAYSKQWAQKFYKTEERKKRKALYSIKDRIGKDGKTKPHILARALAKI